MFVCQAPELRNKEDFDFSRDKFTGIYIGDNEESAPTYLTDIQWFSRALSQQEIWDITSCKSFAKGLCIHG